MQPETNPPASGEGGGALTARLIPFAALCCAYLLANLSVGAMPILFGALVDEWHLSLERAGSVAAAETLGLAVGSAVALALIARFPVTARLLVAGGLVLSIAAQVASGAGAGAEPGLLILARFLSGLCTAVVQAAAIAWISRLAAPQRPLAIFVGMTFVSGTIGIPLFAFTLAQWGLSGTYLVFAGLLLAGLLIVPAIPGLRLASPAPRAAAGEAGAGAGVPRRRERLPLLLAIVLNFIFNGGVWVYLERVGQGAGIGSAEIAGLLGLGMFVALASVVILAIAGPRARDGWVILLSHLALIAATAMLFRIDHWGLFAGAVLLFHIGIALLPPAILSALSVMDPSGRAALEGMAAINIGYAAGPQVYSWIVGLSGFTIPLGVSIAVFVFSLILCLRGRGRV